METERRYAARMLDGPDADKAITGLRNEPSESLIVFTSQYVMAGMLMCKDNDGNPLPGDRLYRRVSRSDLIDTDFEHPNVMLGSGYCYVKTYKIDECDIPEEDKERLRGEGYE